MWAGACVHLQRTNRSCTPTLGRLWPCKQLWWERMPSYARFFIQDLSKPFLICICFIVFFNFFIVYMRNLSHLSLYFWTFRHPDAKRVQFRQKTWRAGYPERQTFLPDIVLLFSLKEEKQIELLLCFPFWSGWCAMLNVGIPAWEFFERWEWGRGGCGVVIWVLNV